MKKNTFWLTNLCNRNVSLYDLNLTIKAFSSINLMDKRHYNYSLEELEKSAASGSIFKKRKMLSVRKVEPTVIKMNIPMVEEVYIPSRERSVFEIKEENYEELLVSDEDFANQNAEMIDDKL
jgi:hypothetical protein